MGKQIIVNAPKAREDWIEGLIVMGILEVTEEGLRCVSENEN